MVARTDKIADKPYSLPTDLRAVLVDRLLESLNIPSQKDINTLWAKEAEKRLRDIKAGKVRTIPGEEIFKDIRRKHVK